jgi:ABC-2 type transport system permease protein
MAKEVFRLVKLNLQVDLGFNESKNSLNPSKKKYFRKNVYVFVLMAVILAFYSSLTAMSMTDPSLINYLPLMGLSFVSLVLIIFGLISTSSSIFNIDSYERLIVLPIRPQAVIQSRIITLWIEDEINALASYLPFIIVYGIYSELNVSSVLIIILSCLLVSLFPMVISAVLNTIISAIFSRFEHRNLIGSIFYMIFFLALMVGSFLVSSSQGGSNDQYIAKMLSILKSVNSYYFVGTWLNDAIVSSSWLSFLWFTLFSVGIYGLFVFVSSIIYIPIAQSMTGGNSSRVSKGEKKKNHVSKPFFCFLKKDLKMYFNSRSYMVNTMFGNVALLFAVIVFAISIKGDVSSLAGFNYDELIPFILGMALAMSSTTYVAISFEGKQWWLSLTLPVKASTIYASKIVMSMIVSLPSQLIASIILASILPHSIVGYILLFVVPVIYSLLSAVVGLRINMAFPKFDWVNETEVIKQSGSGLFSMLVGFVVAIPPVLLGQFLANPYNDLCVCLYALLMLLTAIFLIVKINKKPLVEISKE